MATVQELKSKYKDRIDPTEKDKEKGVVPLTNFEKALIEQGVDPVDAAPTAPDTRRDGVSQAEELEIKEGEKTVTTKGTLKSGKKSEKVSVKKSKDAEEKFVVGEASSSERPK